jgi:hypothetical protein
MGPTQTRRDRRYRLTPRGRYTQHKRRAKVKGVGFFLTFAEWWRLWEPFWELRPHYVMARYGDTGPYELGNVRVVARGENTVERNVTWWRCRAVLRDAAEHEAQLTCPND